MTRNLIANVIVLLLIIILSYNIFSITRAQKTIINTPGHEFVNVENSICQLEDAVFMWEYQKDNLMNQEMESHRLQAMLAQEEKFLNKSLIWLENEQKNSKLVVNNTIYYYETVSQDAAERAKKCIQLRDDIANSKIVIKTIRDDLAKGNDQLSAQKNAISLAISRLKTHAEQITCLKDLNKAKEYINDLNLAGAVIADLTYQTELKRRIENMGITTNNKGFGIIPYTQELSLDEAKQYASVYME